MPGERPNNALQLTGGEGGARQGSPRRAHRVERRPHLNAVFCGQVARARVSGMGVSLYLILDRADPTIVPRLEGKVLRGSLPVLDAIASKVGVKGPQSFMDNRPAPTGFEFSKAPDVKKDAAAFWTWSEAAEKAA